MKSKKPIQEGQGQGQHPERASPTRNRSPMADESSKGSHADTERGEQTDRRAARPEGIEGRHSVPPGERTTPELTDETEDRE